MNLTRSITCIFLAFAVFGVSLCARSPLTFKDRVEAQTAIERIYYNHRIWPKENPGPKPVFEKMVPKAAIEAKVIDYLKKSAALDQFWRRPINTKQLQAEMDRMARETRDPTMLKELFHALNDDPYLIAECLARPALADRLIHNWYANDPLFHKGEKADAEKVMAGGLEKCGQEHGTFVRRIIYTLNLSKPDIGKADADRKEEISRQVVDAGTLARLKAAAPAQGQIGLRETKDAFLVERTVSLDNHSLLMNVAAVRKISFYRWWTRVDERVSPQTALRFSEFRLPAIAVVNETACEDHWSPSALMDVVEPRTHFTAVWTGSEMIVWGGDTGWTFASQTGGRYSPATDTWAGTTTGSGCPSGRNKQTAVWTGSEMIIWGGGDNSGDLVSGGCYNPLTNTWAPTSTGSGCPSPRDFYTAVWTGTEMIIWGGHAASGGFLNTGGRYNPLTDTWIATSTNVSCPAAREQHSAVWTGSVMVIWGGISGSTYANTGGRYDPLTDQWQSTTLSGAPTGRAGALAVWTGSVMVVWGGGGYSNYVTGGCYDPVANSWASTSTYAAPSGRSNASVVWTGSEMIVWGGIKTGVLGDGGRYNPQSDTWTAIPAGGGAPAARCDHEAVWTGSEMIIWGGVIDWLNNQTVNTGGCYDPETGTWTPTSTGPTTCALRNDDTSIWTGAELIVWGGYNGAILSSGGRYYPSTDAWTPTSQGSGCPSGREKHVAVWTGSRMLIWSGSDVASNYADGSSYDPDSDSWTPLPTSLNTPSRRSEAAAVWTGAEMLVWGGWRGPDYLNSGGSE